MPELGAVTGNELKLLFLKANHRLTQLKTSPPTPTPKGVTPSSIEELTNLAELVIFHHTTVIGMSSNY